MIYAIVVLATFLILGAAWLIHAANTAPTYQSEKSRLDHLDTPEGNR